METMYLGESLINTEVVYFIPNNANPPFPCRRVENSRVRIYITLLFPEYFCKNQFLQLIV